MEEENSATVEDDQRQDEVPVKKIRRRKKQLYKAIRKQMEFYFSDANLTKDRFLGKLIAGDPCKYEVASLLSCGKKTTSNFIKKAQ
jgi:La-related protein 7